MPGISDQFKQSLFRDVLTSTPDVSDVDGTGKKTGPGKAGGKGQIGGGTTIGHGGSSPGTGNEWQPTDGLPPPTVNVAAIEGQLQLLNQKLSATQISTSGERMSLDHTKMKKAIKTYQDKIEKEHKEEHKAKEKNKIKDILHAVEDTAEFVGGAAVAVLVPPPAGQIMGGALIATAVINTSDHALTGGYGQKAALTGKAAEALNYSCMGATLTVGMVAGGAGVVAAGGAALDAGEAAVDGVELADLSSSGAEAGADVSEDSIGAADESLDMAGDSEEALDGADMLDEVGNEASEVSEDASENIESMEEQFDRNLTEDIVEDSGGADSSGDGESGGISRAKFAGKIIKAGLKMSAKINAIAQAPQQISDGVNKLTVGKVTQLAEQYEADAEDASKDMQLADADQEQVVGDLQNQMKAFETMDKQFTALIMQYGQGKVEASQSFA